MKKIGIVILSVILCMSMVIPTYAQAIAPRWIGVERADCSLNFVGTLGIIDAEITGDSSVTAITGTMKLYWGILKIDEWEINVQGNSWSVLESFTGTSGRNYKLKLDAQACSGGVWEDVTDEASAECP